MHPSTDLALLKWQLAITHKAKSRGQKAGEGQDDEHCGSNLGVDLAVGHAGYGKANNDKCQVHECQIGGDADKRLAIGFHATSRGKEIGIYGAHDADKQSAVSDGTQISHTS